MLYPFKYPRVVLPVIHVESVEQARRNAGIAFEAGADGVFLISHKPDIDSVELLNIYARVRTMFPKQWIGANFLGADPTRVLRHVPDSMSGVWVDNASISTWQVDQPRAFEIREARRTDWTGLYFGGVAFKYQRPVDDYTLAARTAADYVDVITTSGPKTGQAPSLEKLQALREGAGDHPIAVASGVTPENVGPMLPLVDVFMVASGISESWTSLDPGLTRVLVDRVHRWSA